MEMFVYISITILLFVLFFLIFNKGYKVICNIEDKILSKKYNEENPTVNKQKRNQTNTKKPEKNIYQQKETKFEKDNDSKKKNENKYAEHDYEYSNYSQSSNRTDSVNSKEPETKKEELPECLSVLGFTRIPENKDDIKTRYKKLSKIYHPDMGGTQEEFQRINKAWDEARKLFNIIN